MSISFKIIYAGKRENIFYFTLTLGESVRFINKKVRQSGKNSNAVETPTQTTCGNATGIDA